MKTHSSLQWHNLGKSFILFLILLTLGWFLVSFLTFGGIYVHRYLFAVILFLSAVLAWFYYRYRYHAVFSYDEGGFKLERGRLKTVGRWDEFRSVSLVHLGGGRFAVRLYRTDVGRDDSVDIPASDLELDPSRFRFELMKLLKGSV